MKENYNFLRSFTFNGMETSHLFQIAKVNIPFLSKDNDYYNVGNTDGKHFRNTKLGDYSISIDGFIISDNSKMSVSKTKDELVKIINSDEPKKLILDLFPDRYFSAIFSGTQEYDATDTKYTPFTLVFDVPDALAHQIEPSGYTNVTTTNENLVIDSEFKDIRKYYKPWTVKLVEDNNGSSIIRGDFSTSRPTGFDSVNWDEAWFQMNAYTRRIIKDLTVGTKVKASIEARVVQKNNNFENNGKLIVEEWGINPTRILERHEVVIPATESETFTRYTIDTTIKNKETQAINLAFGSIGNFTIVDFSKPMLSINPAEPFIYVPSETALTENLLVSNNGTYRTYPRYTFKMNSENAMVALINDKGNILQFGNPNDVDVATSLKVETVKWWDFWGDTLGEEWVINRNFDTSYPNYAFDPSKPNVFSGTFDMVKNPDDVTPTFTPNTGTGYWHGPSMLAPFPANSNNERTGPITASIRFNFLYSKIQAMGRVEMNLQDVNGKAVMSVVFRDSTADNDNIYMECIYKNEIQHTYTIDKNKFKNGWREVTLERWSDKIVWRLSQIKSLAPNDNVHVGNEFKYALNIVDTSEIMSYGQWFQRWQNKLHVLMSVSDVKIRWRDVSVTTNVKNIFQDGDIVEIDTKQRVVYVNGVINGDINTVGNEWEKFRLELGDTTITPIVSEWANRPEVTAIVEESYL
ncbi:hypothetical protein OLACOIGA_00062 [Enterococcus phage vB_Efa29212_2e]|nr:hypothetical protein OLACOIGA_00062 [Enterococcus phage vB_Efa29212_2e]